MTISHAGAGNRRDPIQLRHSRRHAPLRRRHPDADTATALYDHLDFQRGVDAFLDGYPGASMMAIRRGLREAGVADNSVVLFSGMMDSTSLFLTGNADTVYFRTFLDLSKGQWSSRHRPRCSASSTTCGFAG